jgi:hypothetical protein
LSGFITTNKETNKQTNKQTVVGIVGTRKDDTLRDPRVCTNVCT